MTAPIAFETRRLRLRRWRSSDHAPFAALNADPIVMEFFPALSTRAASDASIAAWEAQFDARGWSNWAVATLASDVFIGFVGLTMPVRVLPFTPCVEVGWRLAHAHWGQGYASEAARGALAVGFDRLDLAEIVSYTAVGNVRSRAVMERIGMRDAHEDFDHPAMGPDHPLSRHCLYRITREAWQALRGAVDP